MKNAKVCWQPVQPAAHGDPPTGVTATVFEYEDWHQHFGCIHFTIGKEHKKLISLHNIRFILFDVEEE